MFEIPSVKNYTIDTRGTVCNISTNKEFIGHICAATGYRVVTLLNSEKRRVRKYIHRLLAEVYIPNPLNLPEVNHKDGNKLNNCLTNLEWVTGCTNVRHAFTSGLTKNKASLDYQRIPLLLDELCSGKTLLFLAEREGVKDSSTLRKLLKREAIRTGKYREFLLGTVIAKQHQVTKQSIAINSIDCSGNTKQYPSINEAARQHNCSPASIWTAIKKGKEYKNCLWSKQC